MWTREMLKTRAKAVLKLSYWKAFLVSLILIIAGGDSSNSSFRWNADRSDFRNNMNIVNPFGEGTITFFGMAFSVMTLILIFIALRIFLGYALEVGGRRFFKQAAHNDINIGYLGYAFDGERYLSIIKTMLYKGVLNFLQYLLLIIPGIVKAYAYSMVPYILADNPDIGHERAIELSNRMTDGQKFEMFILDLSFIGWYLLGLLLFFVGAFFVKPYENATKAELYLVLRQNALENGFCSYEELLMESLY